MFLLIIFFVCLRLHSIFSSIEQIRVEENSNVTMICQFPLNSANTRHTQNHIILWYKDEKRVIGVNRISNDPKKYSFVQLDHRTYQLEMIEVQLESSGIYKCQNFTSKEENHFQLFVYARPFHLQLQSSTEVLLLDRTAIFNCSSARVYPAPTFQWYLNDRWIQRSLGNQSDDQPFFSWNVLTRSLTPEDHNQILRCEVSNDPTSSPAMIEMQLNIFFKPVIHLMWNNRILNETWSLMFNRSEMIHCRLSANPSASSTLQWFENDQLLMGENQAQLTVHWTGEKKRDKFTCRARNSLGSSEDSVQIDYFYPPKLSINERLILHRGERLVLQCSIDANPRCDRIRWFHNENQLADQPCPSSNSTLTIVEYRIENLTAHQNGNYSCQVNNGFQSEMTSKVSTEVQVQYAPEIFNTPKKLAIIAREEILADCLVDANPRAEITWFSPSNERLSAFTEEKFINNTVLLAQLRLPPAHSTVIGVYQCVAKNPFGERRFSIEFQAAGLPDAVEQFQMTNITYSSIHVQWQASYDGGAEQIFHLILLSNSSEQHRQTKFHSMWFRNLDENSDYRIFIRSANRFGFSSQTKNLTVRTRKMPKILEDFPTIDRIETLTESRVRFQFRSNLRLRLDDLCLQHSDQNSIDSSTISCLPLRSIEISENQFEIELENLDRSLQICSINRTDLCSKSISIPTNTREEKRSTDWIYILSGGIAGLTVLIICLIFCIYIDHRQRKEKSKTGSTDTLKTTADPIPSVSIHVRDSSYNLSYHERLSEHREKLKNSNFDDDDDEYFFNQRVIPRDLINKVFPSSIVESQWTVSQHQSSSDASDSSSSSSSVDVQQIKKLVFEVVV